MNQDEIQVVLDELHTVRPEMLDEKGKILFEAIMSIADERDEYKKTLQFIRKKLFLIYDIGFDYDGYKNSLEGCKSLIDELISYTKECVKKINDCGCFSYTASTIRIIN